MGLYNEVFMINKDKYEEKSKKKLRKEMMKVFYEGNHIKYYLSILIVVVFVLLQIFVANIMKMLIDVATTQNIDELKKFIGLSIIYIIVLAFVQLANNKIKYPFQYKAMKQYKNMVFKKITEKSIASFDSESTGTYISSLTNDAISIDTNYLFTTFDIISNVLLIIGSLGMMFFLSWSLTAVVLISSILPMLVPIIAGKNVAKKEKIVSDKNENFVILVKDLLSGFNVIKSFKSLKEVTMLFKEANHDLEASKCKRRKASNNIGILATVLSFIAEIGVFVYGALLAIRGEITVGVVIAFIQLMNYIVEPIAVLPSLLANRSSAIALIDKFIELSHDCLELDDFIDISNLEYDIKFENFCFGYSEKNVLENVNLTIKKNMSYAIVGSSGCGKSTLLKVLLGEYDDYEGSLR